MPVVIDEDQVTDGHSECHGFDADSHVTSPRIWVMVRGGRWPHRSVCSPFGGRHAAGVIVEPDKAARHASSTCCTVSPPVCAGGNAAFTAATISSAVGAALAAFSASFA